MALNIRPENECELDLISLGETMVRLSPEGHGRIEFADKLEVWVGGGEYNVAYALSRWACAPAGSAAWWTTPSARLICNHARGVGHRYLACRRGCPTTASAAKHASA